MFKKLDERLKSYKLGLNGDKTKLIRFGKKWGGPGSGTIDFLDFTYRRSSCFLTQGSPSWKAGARLIRVTCPEEPDAVTPHVRICEGEIK